MIKCVPVIALKSLECGHCNLFTSGASLCQVLEAEQEMVFSTVFAPKKFMLLLALSLE